MTDRHTDSVCRLSISLKEGGKDRNCARFSPRAFRMLSLIASPFSFCADSLSFPGIVPRPGTKRLASPVSLSPFSFARMALETARVEGRGAPLLTSPADIPSAIVERGWREIPLLKDFLGLPTGVVTLGFSAFAAMAGASVMRGGESPGAAAAAKEATAARAASEAAASEAAANEDFKYRKTSELVSEELANNLFSGSSVDLTKKATVKDFFNVVFLDVRKNSADLSNLNTRVEEIATRTTTNSLVLENNNLVKTAMTRAIQMLVGTSFASWVLVDSWASLATKKIATIIAFNIAAAMLVFVRSRADLVRTYEAGGSHAYKVGPARELA